MNWGKGLEAVVVADLGALLVCRLFVFLVVAVVWVQDVEELADLVLEMGSFGLGIVEAGV